MYLLIIEDVDVFFMSIKAFDDMFSNTAAARKPYTMEELIIGGKFNPVSHKTEDNTKTVLHVNELY